MEISKSMNDILNMHIYRHCVYQLDFEGNLYMVHNIDYC